jgi:hypothetical protein
VASAQRGGAFEAVHCTYASDWRRIVETYGPSLDEADTARIDEILASC